MLLLVSFKNARFEGWILALQFGRRFLYFEVTFYDCNIKASIKVFMKPTTNGWVEVILGSQMSMDLTSYSFT